MRTLQTRRQLSRAALVLLGLGFATGLSFVSVSRAANSLPDDLTRQEIAEWHNTLYESTNALNSPVAAPRACAAGR